MSVQAVDWIHWVQNPTVEGSEAIARDFWFSTSTRAIKRHRFPGSCDRNDPS